MPIHNYRHKLNASYGHMTRPTSSPLTLHASGEYTALHSTNHVHNPQETQQVIFCLRVWLRVEDKTFFEVHNTNTYMYCTKKRRSWAK